MDIEKGENSEFERYISDSQLRLREQGTLLEYPRFLVKPERTESRVTCEIVFNTRQLSVITAFIMSIHPGAL